MRIPQEFYCNDCEKFFLANLNMELNISVLVVCPSCDRKHPRRIKNGQIVEEGYAGKATEEIIGLKVTCRETPYTAKMRKNARDGVILEERWLEKATNEKGLV